MNCYYHSDEPAVATCEDCNTFLCKTCVDKYAPYKLCTRCANSRILHNKEKKKNEKRKALFYAIVPIILSGIYLVVFLFQTLSSGNTMIEELIMGLYYCFGIPALWETIKFLFSSKYTTSSSTGTVTIVPAEYPLFSFICKLFVLVGICGAYGIFLFIKSIIYFVKNKS